jgi:hypothetical protein
LREQVELASHEVHTLLVDEHFTPRQVDEQVSDGDPGGTRQRGMP